MGETQICKFHDFQSLLEMRARVFAVDGQYAWKLVLTLILSEKPSDKKIDFQIWEAQNLLSAAC